MGNSGGKLICGHNKDEQYKLERIISVTIGQKSLKTFLTSDFFQQVKEDGEEIKRKLILIREESEADRVLAKMLLDKGEEE